MKLAQLCKNPTEVHREVRDSHVPTVCNGSALYAAFKENACEIYIFSAQKKHLFLVSLQSRMILPFLVDRKPPTIGTPPPQLEETLTRRHTRATAHAHASASRSNNRNPPGLM